jgi:hypothetical protein
VLLDASKQHTAFIFNGVLELLNPEDVANTHPQNIMIHYHNDTVSYSKTPEYLNRYEQGTKQTKPFNKILVHHSLFQIKE